MIVEIVAWDPDPAVAMLWSMPGIALLAVTISIAATSLRYFLRNTNQVINWRQLATGFAATTILLVIFGAFGSTSYSDGLNSVAIAVYAGSLGVAIFGLSSIAILRPLKICNAFTMTSIISLIVGILALVFEISSGPTAMNGVLRWIGFIPTIIFYSASLTFVFCLGANISIFKIKSDEGI